MSLNTYSNRIRRILYNCLEYAPETHNPSIDKVKKWLECEYILGKIDGSTFLHLRDKVLDDVAKEIIKDL